MTMNNLTEKNQKLAAEILFREGLSKFDVVEKFIQDYYVDLPVENVMSVWEHFHEVILMTKDKKPRYARSVEKLLKDFFHTYLCDLSSKKKVVYEYMDMVKNNDGLWNGNYVGDFLDFVYLHVDEFGASNYHFEWVVDDIILGEEDEEISTHVWSQTQSIPS